MFQLREKILWKQRFAKEITKELIWRNIFWWEQIFEFSTVRRNLLSPEKDFMKTAYVI